ncbi:hypothetical protein [Methanolobus sp. ZRKC5]
MNPTLECGLCSTKMRDPDVYSTTTLVCSFLDHRIGTKVPFCSYECDLAFTLRQHLAENDDLNVQEVITNLEISEDWSNNDVRLAIDKLIAHDDNLIKGALVEYLDYAKEHSLLSE